MRKSCAAPPATGCSGPLGAPALAGPPAAVYAVRMPPRTGWVPVAGLHTSVAFVNRWDATPLTSVASLPSGRPKPWMLRDHAEYMPPRTTETLVRGV